MSNPTPPSSQIDQAADERQEAARRYVEQLRAFHVHAAVFAASMTAIFAVNLLTNLSAGIASEWSAWWSMWALIGWGAGIAVHGLVVRLNRPSLGSSTWEQRQIEKMLGE
jgi:hypothetical protein